MAFADPLAPNTELQLDHIVRMEAMEQDIVKLCNAINKHAGLQLPCTGGAKLYASAGPVDVAAHYTGAAASCLPAIIRFYCQDFISLNVTLLVDGGERFDIPQGWCDQ